MDDISEDKSIDPSPSRTSPFQSLGVRIVGAGFVVAICAAVILASEAYRNNRTYSARNELVSHTRSVVESTYEARNDAFTAVSSLLSYSMKGDARELARLPTLAAKMRLDVAGLRNLTNDSQDRLAQLDAIDRSLAEVDRYSAIVNRDAATQNSDHVVKSQDFAQLSQSIYDLRQRFHQISIDESRLLAERIAIARRASRNQLILISVGSGVITLWLIFLGIVSYVLLSRLRRTAVALEDSRSSLHEFNVTLEDRVRERSATLGEQNELLEAILNRMTEAVIVTDLETRPVLMNATGTAELGDVERAAQWLEKYDVFFGNSSEPLRPDEGLTRRVIEGTSIENFEVRAHNRETGADRWVEISAHPLRRADGTTRGALMILRDITARRQAQIDHSLYASVVRFAPDAVISLSRDGTVTSWSPAAEKLFGYTHEEALGKPYASIIPPGLAAEFEKQQTALTAGQSIQDLETRLIHKDGHEVEIVFSASPIYSLPGRLEGFAVVVRDNTERKLLQERMKRARDLAIEAAQTRSEFLANMSHEIRTPLNAIIGMSELLRQSDLTEEQSHGAAIIESSGELLMKIVDDVLDFSKLSAGKVVLENLVFDFPLLVETTIESFSETADAKGLRLETHLDDELAKKVKGDPIRLRQILNNLLSNAIKFTAQGHVRLSVRKVEEDQNALVVRFEVSDTGIGVPAAAQDRLFEPFKQAESSTARRFGGTGLGLVISAQLVRQMGGDIGFKSEAGKGSTFHFTARLEKVTEATDGDEAQPQMDHQAIAALPSSPRPHTPVHLDDVVDGKHGHRVQGGFIDTASDEQRRRRRKLRILVVEDNRMNRLLAARQLQTLGCRADLVGDAKAAFDALDHNRYDIALMDCEMPGMDGFETTRELRRREQGKRHTTVVAMTAYATQDTRERCFAAGMDGFLSKPVRLKTLADALDSWVAKSAEPGEAKEPAPVEVKTGSFNGPVNYQELDSGILSELRELSGTTGGDLVRELVEAFLSELPGRVSSLKDALAANDPTAIARAAHAMAGAGGLGARRYAALCNTIEDHALNHELEKATALARALLAEAEVLPATLKQAAGME